MITKFRAQKSRDPLPLNQTREGRTGLRKAEQGEVKGGKKGNGEKGVGKGGGDGRRETEMK